MDKELLERGIRTRREVLGDAYVDASMKNADEFTRPFQEMISEYAWGGVWTRPELPRKTRSFLNLAMLTALNRPHELELHLNGALNNGMTKEEIREVFMQAAIYCGVPAALDAFRIARKVFQERGI